jgi:antitoxin component YwqK of YwqJK toxin-antitoxin module
MKHTLILLLFSCAAWGQTEPCQKKYITGKNKYSIEIYPHCYDTTMFLVRFYEDNKLWKEEWFKNNIPNGLSIIYSWKDNTIMKSSEVFFGDDLKILHSTSYFPNSNLISHSTKAITDSTAFSISYYQNGNIKEYGNLKSDMNCNYGQWTETDSLGNFKWVGGYKIVRREKIDTTILPKTGEMVITKLISLYEKDGVWKKTNKNDKVIEQVIYVDGKLKE